MGKISTSYISRLLVEKNKLSQREADAFVADFFDAIKQALDSDHQVKVKGLGTFKIVGVEARASVSVNTGERVIINGHEKVTFTPETSMKELVNKPFAQFETVVLNDGVTFDDIEKTAAVSLGTETEVEESSETETAVESLGTETLAEESLGTETLAEESLGTETLAEEEPQQPVIAEEQPEAEAEPTPEEPSETEALAEEEPSETETEIESLGTEALAEEEPSETEAIAEEDCHSSGAWKKLLLAMLIILLIAGAFVGGYYVATMHNGNAVEYAEVEAYSPDDIDSGALSKDSIAGGVADSVATSKASAENADSSKVATMDKVAPQQQTKAEKYDTPDYRAYNEMDKRLKNGAYFIMGTKSVEKAQTGDNSRRLAVRYLGDPEMKCYIEVYNGITSKDTLEKGQEVKIPKLRTKKYVIAKEKRETNN